MNTLSIVFLGIIAAGALMQAAFFAAAAWASWMAARRIDDWAERAERALTEQSERVEQLTARVEALSRQAHEALRRTEPVVDSVAERTERVGEVLRHAAALPFVPWRNGAALVFGLLRAVDVYRHLRRRPALSRH
jgi:hypothetical protein